MKEQGLNILVEDDFDAEAQQAWERRKRLRAAVTIVVGLRALPVEDAALRLLAMFDSVATPNSPASPTKRGGRATLTTWRSWSAYPAPSLFRPNVPSD